MSEARCPPSDCYSFVSSWIETRDIQSEKANLMILFDKYVPACLEVLRTRLKKITPVPEISHIQMLCNLLGKSRPRDDPGEWTYITYDAVGF